MTAYATGRPIEITCELNAEEAAALAQMCKRFTWEHARQLSNRHVQSEHEHMLNAIDRLRTALRDVGFDPR
jgi:hypothetical protein